MMVSPEDEVRNVAQAFVHGSGAYNPNLPSSSLDVSQSYSVNTSVRPEYVLPEDFIAGQRSNGRMSNVRRFFCLFVTFDFLFTSLMWLICIMLDGDNIWKALDKQIRHYDIHKSLFDIVLTAACRFTVLLLFYALLYINHWIVICLSTSGTCIFLIAKVFVFNWQDSPQPVFQVLLILISFVLSWGEAWFLDFKVIPQENHAKQYIIASPGSERAPLIRSYVQGLPSMYTESVGNFYSPLASPEGSLHRFDNEQAVRSRYPSIQLTSEQEIAYKSTGAKILQEAWALLNNTEWKLEKESDGDKVFTLSVPKSTKIFKLVAYIDVAPRFLLDELFYKVENIPSWNPSLLESHKIQAIDEHTDISYQISADAAAGAVASRDFISLRKWGIIDHCYIIANIATEHPSVPKNEKCIRGENGVGCWVMRPIQGSSESCSFEWVLNSNLKGWIPQYILDPAFVKMMLEYVSHLRKHLKKLRDEGKL